MVQGQQYQGDGQYWEGCDDQYVGYQGGLGEYWYLYQFYVWGVYFEDGDEEVDIIECGI